MGSAGRLSLEKHNVKPMNETENQTRLRRAKDALAFARETETSARKALSDAVEATKRAKERYEDLFLAEEQAECARLKSTYDHATK